jgi:hypothetical protein
MWLLESIFVLESRLSKSALTSEIWPWPLVILMYDGKYCARSNEKTCQWNFVLYCDYMRSLAQPKQPMASVLWIILWDVPNTILDHHGQCYGFLRGFDSERYRQKLTSLSPKTSLGAGRTHPPILTGAGNTCIPASCMKGNDAYSKILHGRHLEKQR